MQKSLGVGVPKNKLGEIGLAQFFSEYPAVGKYTVPADKSFTFLVLRDGCQHGSAHIGFSERGVSRIVAISPSCEHHVEVDATVLAQIRNVGDRGDVDPIQRR